VVNGFVPPAHRADFSGATYHTGKRTMMTAEIVDESAARCSKPSCSYRSMEQF
jgi:hypothetical protein